MRKFDFARNFTTLFIESVVVVILLSLILFTHCSVIAPNFKYIKQLPDDLRGWYDMHYYHMGGKVPEWIDARKLTESKHFLRLPTEELQRKYIAVFWKMRTRGLRGIFRERLAEARKYFDEGIKNRLSDRGYVFLKFGYPMNSYTYRDMMGRPYSNVTSFDGSSLLIWEYLHRGNLVRYVFKFEPPSGWKMAYLNLLDMGNQSAHHRWFIKTWQPTSEGWNMWATELLDWVHENEGDGKVKKFIEELNLEMR